MKVHEWKIADIASFKGCRCFWMRTQDNSGNLEPGNPRSGRSFSPQQGTLETIIRDLVEHDVAAFSPQRMQTPVSLRLRDRVARWGSGATGTRARPRWSSSGSRWPPATSCCWPAPCGRAPPQPAACPPEILLYLPGVDTLWSGIPGKGWGVAYMYWTKGHPLELPIEHVTADRSTSLTQPLPFPGTPPAPRCPLRPCMLPHAARHQIHHAAPQGVPAGPRVKSSPFRLDYARHTTPLERERELAQCHRVGAQRRSARGHSPGASLRASAGAGLGSACGPRRPAWTAPTIAACDGMSAICQPCLSVRMCICPAVPANIFKVGVFMLGGKRKPSGSCLIVFLEGNLF